MSIDIPKDLKGDIKHAITTWAVGTGLVMVEKYLMFCDLKSKESVLLIMKMLVDGMVDCACSALSMECKQSTSKIRSVLAGMSRQILGSVQMQFSRCSPQKQKAEQLAKHWRMLQAAKKAFTDQERQGKKTQARNLVPQPVVR